MKSTWHDVAMWTITVAGLLVGLILFGVSSRYDRDGRLFATIAVCAGISGIVGLIVLDRIRRLNPPVQ